MIALIEGRARGPVEHFGLWGGVGRKEECTSTPKEGEVKENRKK